jgi:hypothetical protein
VAGGRRRVILGDRLGEPSWGDPVTRSGAVIGRKALNVLVITSSASHRRIVAYSVPN